MNKRYKRWLLAVVLIIMVVLFFEWLVNRNRGKTNLQDGNVIQHDGK